MKFILFIFILFSQIVFSQKIDSSKKIKSTREKIHFINDSIQNYKLFEIDGDYGHGGFTGPKSTIKRFHQHWYNETFVHYINNKRSFNEKGLLIHEDWFDKIDEKIASYDYTYTEFDSLSKIREYDRFDEEHITQISYFGKKIQSVLSYWSNDTQNFTLTFNNYDDKDNIKLVEHLNRDGHGIDKHYVYDKLGRLEKVINHTPFVYKELEGKSYTTVRDSAGVFYNSFINRYDNNNKLIEKNEFSHPDYKNESIIVRKIFYKYDKNDNLIEIKRTPMRSKMIYLNSFKYDSKKRKIFEANHSADEIQPYQNQKESIYKKDELKRLYIVYDGRKYIVEFNYKYDSFGNWVEQTKSINGKKLFIWSREIEYY